MRQTAPVPDCTNCIHKATCPDAEAGTFCGRFTSKQPKPRRGIDPNKAWRTGQDSDH